MARLLDTGTNRFYPLRAHHTFGRSTDKVDTSVTNPSASRIHAAFQWNGQGWQVRDLSRNGTWVAGLRLPISEDVDVIAGDKICFGSPDGDFWQFVDDSPPCSLLLANTSDTSTVELKPYTFLPDEGNPEIVVTYSQKRRCWLSHRIKDTDSEQPDSELKHGELLSSNGQQWKVFLAESESSTEQYSEVETQLGDFEFVFDLSLDEENTILRLKRQKKTLDMGERTHHYLLLHLARIRAMAAQHGLDRNTEGWVANDQLTKDLGMDMAHINILIFRARKQLAESSEASLESEHLVERGKGRLRFGCPRFKIYKGQQLAYQMPISDAVFT
jgi:pSer/pThr/pTyr-binding forkhead associated (FHA) protein